MSKKQAPPASSKPKKGVTRYPRRGMTLAIGCASAANRNAEKQITVPSGAFEELGIPKGQKYVGVVVDKSEVPGAKKDKLIIFERNRKSGSTYTSFQLPSRGLKSTPETGQKAVIKISGVHIVLLSENLIV